MCLLRSRAVVQKNSHGMQVKGFSPECVSVCFLRSPFIVHLYSHYCQLNGFTPVWNRMWTFRWEVAVNEEAHIGFLSPPFFVLVWSVKRIVQSSVFADTFHKFIPMLIFLCPAINVTIHAQRLMPSRNTCALIQERSLLVATNVIFPAWPQDTHSNPLRCEAFHSSSTSQDTHSHTHWSKALYM